MAGSMKWLSYTTNAGDTFAVFADESNAEAAGTAVDVTGGASTLYALPRNIKPRYARYSDATNTIVRKAIISLVAGVPTTPIIDALTGISLTLTGIVGEQQRVVRGDDTGLIDGDAS